MACLDSPDAWMILAKYITSILTKVVLMALWPFAHNEW